MRYTVEQLCERFNKVKSDRAHIESHWEDIAKFFLPERTATFIQSIPGQRFDRTVYDTTGMYALQIAAAGVHGFLTNPSERWFALGIIGTDKVDNESKDWLAEAEEKAFEEFNRTNFNEQIHEAYLDLFGFGTACFYQEEQIDKLHYSTRPMSEIFMVEGDKEEIDMVFRYFDITARQAYQKWGDKAGETVKTKLSAMRPDDKVEFLHIVMPRQERDSSKIDRLNKPYASLWIDYKLRHLVDEGGYDFMPYMLPRFSKTSGHTYGYSPAMIALSDARMLNEMCKTTLVAAQKLVDPPIILPNDGYLLPFDQTPGAINYRQQSTEDKLEVLKIPHEIPISLEMEERRRQAIKDIMFTDLFLMLAALKDKQMTAKEVTERVTERMIILAPVLGRLMRGLLVPSVETAFRFILSRGKIRKPPQALQGRESNVDFISPLAMAQKAAKGGSINEMMMIIMNMAQGLPQILDIVDAVKVGRAISETYNLTHLTRDDEELQALWEERAEQQEMQEMMQAAETAGKVSKDMAQTQPKAE